MPSDQEMDGNDNESVRPTTENADDAWYEAFADRVHSFGKKWPDILTPDEERDAAAYADSKAPRPVHERWDLPDNED